MFTTLTTALLPLSLSHLANSTPVQTGHLYSTDADGFIKYRGNSNVNACLWVNDDRAIEIRQCPIVDNEFGRGVYGWAVYNNTEGQLLAPLRLAPQICLASGISNGVTGPLTRKLRLRSCLNGNTRGIDIMDPVDLNFMIDNTAQRIKLKYQNTCLYAKNGVGSICDSDKGGTWIGNETLVMRDCDAVKNDDRAKFDFVKTLY
jgi:hypothetical protein